MTWISTSGRTANSPLNGRSCAAINISETETAAAKIPIARAAVQAVVAVDERDRDQRQQRDEDHAGPLHPVDARLTEDDALPASVERGLERSTISRCAVFWPSVRGDRPMASCSPWASGAGIDGQRRTLVAIAGHSSSVGLADVAANERVHTGLGLAGKGMDKEDDRPQRTRLPVDRFLRPPGVAPHLRRQKADDEGEEQPHGRQHPGRERLEGLSALPDGEGHHDEVDRRRDEGRHAEHEERQPRKGQVLQPARDARGRPDSGDPIR